MLEDSLPIRRANDSVSTPPILFRFYRLDHIENVVIEALVNPDGADDRSLILHSPSPSSNPAFRISHHAEP